jgi:hypothetical protein
VRTGRMELRDDLANAVNGNAPLRTTAVPVQGIKYYRAQSGDRVPAVCMRVATPGQAPAIVNVAPINVSGATRRSRSA